MIQLIPVNQTKEPEQTLKNIYLEAFPPDERRNWKELLELTQQYYFNLYCINIGNIPAGMITLWKWPEITFIEHFAIGKTFQGKGTGSEVLNHLMQETSGKIILETEEPNTEAAKRRVSFYTRLGFHLCHEEYYQPAYSKNKKAVKMQLMSFPDTITQTEFITIKTKLYKEVYNRNLKGIS